jgi:quinoprotein glucose dehydrogenase
LATVTERAVPQGVAAGDRISPTQPFSTGLPSFAGPRLTEKMMWGITPFDQLHCRIKFRQARYEGTMTPPGLERPIITYPGYLGGMDWGSVAVDPARGIMIVNSNRMANYNRLLPRAEADRMGLKPNQPGSAGNVGGPVAQAGTPYAAQITPFLSPIGAPCQQPPYGMLSAVDLRTGKLLWTQRFGTGRDSGPFGMASHLPFTMGVPSIGGSAATASGLFFIAASQDQYLRAYETLSGKELWRARLPAGGQATPMTYASRASGRQFVVIAAGGHGGLATKGGDYVVAYALPREKRRN